MTELRRCDLRDLKTLADLSLDTFVKTFGPVNTPENIEEYTKTAFSDAALQLELQNPASEFYLLWCDERPAGYLKLNETAAQTEFHDEKALEIERIYVDDDFQGKGLGGQLIEAAVLKAKERLKEYVFLGVWEKNEKAIGFYKRYGFYPVGSHGFMLGNDAQTDLLMRLDLKNK